MGIARATAATYRQGLFVVWPLTICFVLLGVAVQGVHAAVVRQAQREELQRRLEKVHRDVAFILLDARQRARAARLGDPRSWQEPEVVARGADPSSLALEDGEIFWLDASAREVRRASTTAGGGSSAVASSGPLDHRPHESTIALSEQHVVWLSYDSELSRGSVMRAPRSGGQAERLTPVFGRPLSLVAHHGTLYWVDRATGRGGSGTAALMRRAPDGQVARLAEVRDACGLTTREGELLWVEPGAPARLVAMPMEGGERRVVVTGSGALGCRFAVDDGHVYWINSSVDALVRMDLGGGIIETVALQGEDLVEVVAHGGAVYSLSASAQGALSAVLWGAQQEGKRSRPLAVDLGRAAALAIDAEHVYFVRRGEERSEGQVLRLDR